MAISHKSGPDVIYGQVPNQGSYPANVGADYNPAFAPSVAFGGQNLMDIRVPYNPGQPRGTPIPGWIAGDYLVVDQIPYASTSNNIASTQSATAGTALSLVTSSAMGVVPSVSITSATSGLTVTGLLSLDGSVAMINYAPIAGSVQSYDPRTMLSRVVTMNNLSGTTDATTTWTVVGFDVYGYRMSDAITGATAISSAGANAVTVNGKKAFKYIQSVTPSGASASTNVSVGTADIFGYPLTAYEFALTTTQWASATVSGTGYTQPSTYTTATSTTGDARGTFASSAAANGTNTSTGLKLMMTVMVPPWAHVASTSTPGVISATGLTGVQA